MKRLENDQASYVIKRPHRVNDRNERDRAMWQIKHLHYLVDEEVEVFLSLSFATPLFRSFLGSPSCLRSTISP